MADSTAQLMKLLSERGKVKTAEELLGEQATGLAEAAGPQETIGGALVEGALGGFGVAKTAEGAKKRSKRQEAIDGKIEHQLLVQAHTEQEKAKAEQVMKAKAVQLKNQEYIDVSVGSALALPVAQQGDAILGKLMANDEIRNIAVQDLGFSPTSARSTGRDGEFVFEDAQGNSEVMSVMKLLSPETQTQIAALRAKQQSLTLEGKKTWLVQDAQGGTTTVFGSLEEATQQGRVIGETAIKTEATGEDVGLLDPKNKIIGEQVKVLTGARQLEDAIANATTLIQESPEATTFAGVLQRTGARIGASVEALLPISKGTPFEGALSFISQDETGGEDFNKVLKANLADKKGMKNSYQLALAETTIGYLRAEALDPGKKTDKDIERLSPNLAGFASPEEAMAGLDFITKEVQGKVATAIAVGKATDPTFDPTPFGYGPKSGFTDEKRKRLEELRAKQAAGKL